MTRTLFDTSTLIAASCSWHESHQPCRDAWQDRLESGSAILAAAHSLVEVYSVLTRLPPPHRLSPATAHQLVRENLKDKQIVDLRARDYWSVLDDCCDSGIAGGTVYDALIVRAAILGKAEELITLNESHFLRLAPPTLKIRKP